jgi:hypothetical protein
MGKCIHLVQIFLPIFRVKESRKILSLQKGVTRINCLDCLDRTNVFQMKVCGSVMEEILQTELANDTYGILLTNLWALSGDCISKIYAGTSSVLTSVAIKGKESMLDKLDHSYTSVKRFLKQNISDDFK